MNLDTLKATLKTAEGWRATPYTDTTGNQTIAYGHRLATPIKQDVGDLILEDDITDVVNSLNGMLPWWVTRPESVQQSLSELCYNLGLQGLLGFHRMLACVQAGDYQGAHDALLDSLADHQEPNRIQRIANQILAAEN